MKTLIATLAVLTLSFTTALAKDGTFTTVIVKDSDKPLDLTVESHHWIKIINFVQNDGDTETYPAGIAVFKGDAVAWVLFAGSPSATSAPVVIEGPAIVSVRFSGKTTGASALLTYQRGSD
jgi:hypothetical protein